MCQMSNSLQKMFRIPAAILARRIVYPVRKFSGIYGLGCLCNFLHHFQPLQLQICQYKANRRYPQKTTSASYRKKFRLPLKPQPPVRKQLENLTKKPPTPFSMRLKSIAFAAPYAIDQTAPTSPRKKWQNTDPPKPFTGAKIPVTPKIIVFEDKKAVEAVKSGTAKHLNDKNSVRFEGIEVFNEDKKQVESEMTRKLRNFLSGSNLKVAREFGAVEAAAVPNFPEDVVEVQTPSTAKRLKNLLMQGGSLKIHRDIKPVKEVDVEEVGEGGGKKQDSVRQIVVDGNIEGTKKLEETEAETIQKQTISEDEKVKNTTEKVSMTPTSINFDGTTPILTGTMGDKNNDGGSDNSWRILKYSFGLSCLACACAFGYAVKFFGAPKVDTDGDEIEDEYSNMPLLQQYLMRAAAEINYYNKMIKEPSRDKLLPDPLVPPYYQPPYTLVLEFTDVLVHPEWTYSTGWRFKKRPGLDKFLETLASRFELVVYTAEMGMTVFPIIDALDKNNLISYKLVRDATHFVDGHHVKDLDKLNRDLSKVVVVDWNPNSTKLHGENLFRIDRWDGNDQDTTLTDLTNFLNAISEWEIDDVRKVLSYYSQFKDPLGTFKQRQRELLNEEGG